MEKIIGQIKADLNALVAQCIDKQFLKRDDLFVIGCSTSEVAGKQIGTAGSEEIAALIFAALQKLQGETKIHLAFQCCEHLNRALVLERSVQKSLQLEEVSVIPIPQAGGSMAAYAYNHFSNPVVVESVQAAAGIDIGDTLIGMHLRQVAVPIRFQQKTIGQARVTAARTRPKLIGGERAQYKTLY